MTVFLSVELEVDTNVSCQKKGKNEDQNRMCRKFRKLATNVTKRSNVLPNYSCTFGRIVVKGKIDYWWKYCELIDKEKRNYRPYVCSYCSRRFAQKHNLTIHIRTHTNERYPIWRFNESSRRNLSKSFFLFIPQAIPVWNLQQTICSAG